MRFSVIIPAHNEEKLIGVAIRALAAQTVSRSAYEIIVVNDTSADDTAGAARRAGADIVVEEAEPGTNFARQRGVREAHGDVLCFLDADNIAPPDWLARIEMHLQKPGVALVSGPYDFSFTGLLRTVDRIYIRLVIDLVSLLPVFFGIKTAPIMEGNFAAWRWAIEKIGGLPPLRFFGDGAAIVRLITAKAGTIVFDLNLTVQSSKRRWQSWGFIRSLYRYNRAFLMVYFKGEKAYDTLNRESEKALGMMVSRVS